MPESPSLGPQLRQFYADGRNIMAALRSACALDSNSEEIIAASYDMQAGTYVRARREPANAAGCAAYAGEVAAVLRLLHPKSLLEAGVGEATTLCDVIDAVGIAGEDAWGLDVSWSRVAVGRQYAREIGKRSVKLFVGSLLNIPLCDNSIDIVYTSHSIEPNRGREREALRELYRVARRYVVLFEPLYELASDEAKARMDLHCYCRGLHDCALNEGMKVIEHRLLNKAENPLNPTGVIVIEKNSPHEQPPAFICPESKAPLIEAGGNYYCDASLLVYPAILGIPCLLPGNGMLASKYAEIAKAHRD